MINKTILLSLSVFCFMLFSVTEGQAQRKEKKSTVDEYFDESDGWKHRLWFGGSVNPGFTSFNGQTNFFFGISPMLGIKVFESNDRFSVGPRGSFEYTYRKFFNRYINEFDALQPISYSFGAFARYKVLPNFFPHAEIEFENRGIPIDNGSSFVVERQTSQNIYFGGGYNSGGLLGYEILVLYNINEPTNSPNSPFDIRFGLTYKF